MTSDKGGGEVSVDSSSDGRPRYAAFISYSHALDDTLAPALQSGLEQFGRVWYRRRALRVFRDDSNLSATPRLWGSIEEALSSSEWFILLASPDAARSPWVSREVRWWLEHRSPDRLVLGLTAGDIAWNPKNGRIDQRATNALPRVLVDHRLPEPRWIDFRKVRTAESSDPAFQSAVAELAAPLHGLPKDDLVGEHVHQHRVRRRWIASATIALVLLTVLSTVTAVVAVNQRNRANEQTTIATARQLAAAVQANIGGRIDLARLLAAEAYRLRPDTRTRSALLQATVASPQLQLFLPIDAKVTSLKSSANEDEFVVGSQDGRVRVFDESGGVRFTVSGVPAPVTVTAIDPSRSWLVAGNDRQLLIWDRNAPDSQPRTVPALGPLIDVELSGSGQQLAVLGSRATERSGNIIGRVSLFDTKNLGNLSNSEIDIGSADYISTENPMPHVAFSLESMLHIWSGACNRVVLRSPDLTPAVSESGSCTPANRFIEASSPSATSGAYFIFGTVEIFLGANPTTRRFAVLPVDKAELLSISRDANRVAVVQSGSIFVTPTSESPPSAADAADAVRLDGASGITRVEFLRGNRLVSAADGGLQLWDTTAVSPLVQRTGLTTPEIVGFIDRPSIELSSDSRFAAVSDEEGAVTILDLTDGKLRATLATTNLPTPVAIAWAPDGRAIMAVGGDGSRQAWRLDSPVPTKSGSWPGPPDSVGLDQVAGAAWSTEGTLYVIDLDGTVVAYNPIGTDAKLVLAGQTLSSIGALSKLRPDARYATRAATRGIDLIELPAGVRRHIDLDSPPLSVEFLGADRLVVGRQDGVLEVRNMIGGAVESVLNIDAGNVDSLATSAETFVSVGLNRDISILSPESNEVIGRFQLPQLASIRIGVTPATATAVELASDGMSLITATSGGEVLLWRLNPELEVSAACRTANRNLSADEWLRLVGTDPPADLRCNR